MFPSAYIRRSLRYHGSSPKTAKITNSFVRRLVTLIRGTGWALTHLSYYFHRERYFPNFELLLSRACPFDCKCCIHFIPEYESNQEEPAERVIADMQKLLLAVERIDELVISGGDAFLYPKLETVVRYLITSEKIGRVVIVSSGDVSPSEKIVQMLPDKRILIKVDNYGDYSKKIDEFVSLPIESIRIDGIYDTWLDFGNEKCRNRSEKELERQYASCKSERYCMLNGKIYACPRSAHGANLGYFTTGANETVDLRTITNSKELLGKIKELRRIRYLNACNHCNGATEDFKTYSQDIRFKAQ